MHHLHGGGFTSLPRRTIRHFHAGRFITSKQEASSFPSTRSRHFQARRFVFPKQNDSSFPSGTINHFQESRCVIFKQDDSPFPDRKTFHDATSKQRPNKVSYPIPQNAGETKQSLEPCAQKAAGETKVSYHVLKRSLDRPKSHTICPKG